MNFSGEPLLLEDLDDDQLADEDFEEDMVWSQHVIDDSLDFISKLERYHSSDMPSQRIVLLQELGENLQDLDVRVVMEKVLPIFWKFSTDVVPAVRKEYVLQMKSLASYLLRSTREDSRLEVYQTVIPSCFDLTVDDNAEVSSCAVDSIVAIASFLEDIEMEESICQVVNLFSHDDRDEECRVVAIRIYNRLANRFNPYRLDLVVSELTNLADDMSCYVRSAVGRNIHSVMSTLGSSDAYSRLYPVFQTLCRDEMPEVRAACAGNFTDVIRAIDPGIHWKEISEDANFLFESHSSVQQAILRIAGNYISLIPSEYISPELVLRFADIPRNEETSDLSEICAVNLLDVSKAIGADRWEELSLCFTMLVHSNENCVKRVIAEQLPNIAMQFDPVTAYSYFFPVFQYFLETEDTVKIEMIKRTRSLIEVFPKSDQESCIALVADTLKETQNWRVRQAVGEGLRDLLRLCSASFVLNVISEIALRMLRDSVSVVRQTGASLIAACVEFLKQQNSDTGHIIEQLGYLASSDHYAFRLIFVAVIEKVNVNSPNVLHEHFTEKMMHLATDNVANVRIRVAKFLSSLATCEYSLFSLSLDNLKRDSDAEVRWCALGTRTEKCSA
ncbi:hypothetical protein XU18_0199 [Perkinsela sp. CCAP 1560/4]|nr:hypothetical protein XU18_0199 [Perkinsela sp. CCAP 1560/4]|eukprot:KNH09514.1 hypothetical protein XU18_0199 [Perkinsela sp. CCAP 1560/4]